MTEIRNQKSEIVNREPVNPVQASGFRLLSSVVIASHNQDKVREIEQMIAPFGLTVISAGEARLPEPEETGSTFAENAILKASQAATASGLPALADDSGLAIPALGGAPGIYSARWAGPDKDFAAAFDRICKELGDQPADAYFMCVLALCYPSPARGEGIYLFEGRIDGALTFPPRGDHGFGYDPIFIPHGYDRTFGEIDPAEKNRISHRAQAFAKFLAYLREQS